MIDLAVPAAVAAGAALLAVLLPRLFVEPYRLLLLAVFGLPLVAVYILQERPLRFALALAGIFAASALFRVDEGQRLFSERNFFGTLRVERFADGPSLRFYHGSTLHGMQSLAAGERGEPLAYFHRLGPFGQVMREFNSRPGPRRVGVIGVGIGSMLAYARPSQRWTYYEIDPDVVDLARDGRFFTFFRDTRAADVDVVIGDARLKMAAAPDAGFDLVVLDAFNSDVVPTHLLTSEAFALYRQKLAPGGFLAAHISSQNLDLSPVVAAVARGLGLYCLVQKDDWVLKDGQPIPGKFPSVWAVLARAPADAGQLARDPRWQPAPRVGRRPWTDDYSNILAVLRWF
jgi:hypothetical protein